MDSNTLPSSLCNGRYHTSHVLGTGTYGQVICCVDTYTNTSVAVKVSRKDNAYRCAALNEIAALNALHDNHDSVQMLDWFDENEHICIVTELLHQNLYEALREREFAPLTVQEIQAVALRVCSALHCLHIAGYMHCDIKPENIMLKNELSQTYNCTHATSTSSNDVNITSHSGDLIASDKSVSTMHSYDYCKLADYHVPMYNNSINADNEWEEYENRVNKAIYHNMQRAQQMQEYRGKGYNDTYNNYNNNKNKGIISNNNNLLEGNNYCVDNFTMHQIESGDCVNFNQLQGGKYNHVCVIDFGAVRQFHENAYYDVQSLWYRAPEVLCGVPYTPSIDAWSVGCVLFELFTGKAIFPGHNAEDQLQRIIQLVGYPSTNALNNGTCVGQMRVPFLNTFTHHDIIQNLRQYIVTSRQSALHRYSHSHRHRHRDCEENNISKRQSDLTCKVSANLATQYQVQQHLLDLNNTDHFIINMNNNNNNDNCTPNQVNTSLTANFDMHNANMLQNSCIVDIAQEQQFMLIQQQQQQLHMQQQMQQQQKQQKQQQEEQLEEWLVDLIIQMLNPDETRRLSCTDALQHPFLQQVYAAEKQIEQQRVLSAQEAQNNTPTGEFVNADYSNSPMVVYAQQQQQQQQQQQVSSFQNGHALMQTSNLINCDSMEALMNKAIPCESLEHVRTYTPSYISLTSTSSSSLSSEESTELSSLEMSSHDKMENNVDNAIVSYLPKGNVYMSNAVQSTDSIAYYYSQPHTNEVRHLPAIQTIPIVTNRNNNNNCNTNMNIDNCITYNPNFTNHKGNDEVQQVEIQSTQHNFYSLQQQQQQQQHVLSLISLNQMEQNVNVQNHSVTLLPTTMVMAQTSTVQQATQAPQLLMPYWANNAPIQPNHCTEIQHNVSCNSNTMHLNNHRNNNINVNNQPIPVCYDRQCHYTAINNNNNNDHQCCYENVDTNVCNSNEYTGGRRWLHQFFNTQWEQPILAMAGLRELLT